MMKCGVPFEVQTEFLYTVYMGSRFKGLIILHLHPLTCSMSELILRQFNPSDIWWDQLNGRLAHHKVSTHTGQHKIQNRGYKKMTAQCSLMEADRRFRGLYSLNNHPDDGGSMHLLNVGLLR
jgi:hypothetical protein